MGRQTQEDSHMEASETTEATAVEVTAPETSIDSAAPASSDSGVELVADSVEAAAPAFTPDYKLKVYDEEKEIQDPFLKALIKDSESEKKVKEIAQKSMAFDTVKTRHESLRSEYQTFQQQAQPVLELYNNYAKLAQKGDLEGIFDLLKISEQDIYNFALKKAEQTPEQKAWQQSQRQIQQEKEYLESQNQNLLTDRQRQLSEFRAQELNWVMARPEVHGTASAYDAKNGPGAFRQFVRKVALAHYADTQGKEDLSADQAVQEAMKMIGGFVTPTNLNAPQAAPQAQLIPQTGGQPPIIPNVNARAVSPVKRQIRSLDDLKRKGEELGSS